MNKPEPIRAQKLIISKGDLLEEVKPTKVAEVLGISRSAVSQWGEIIPELSAKKILELMPQIPHKYI